MLAEAISAGAMERIEELVRQGADLNRRDRDDYLLPLGRAIAVAPAEVAFLLLRLGADAQGDPKRGAPFEQAIVRGDAQLVGALIDAGAKVDLPNSDGSTPLGVAQAWGHSAVIERLRAAGARRAVHVIPRAVVEYLARRGPRPPPSPPAAPLTDARAQAKAERQAAFLAAVDGQDIPRVQELLGGGVALCQPDDHERTPLEHAIETGNANLVRLLVEAGAKPDQGGYYFPSTLCYAAECGNLEIVQALVEAGADVNAPVRFLGSPLKIATKGGHLAIVQWLLAQGASPEVGPDCHVIQWAAELGQEAIVEALLPLVSDELRAAAYQAFARSLELRRREAHIPSNRLQAAAKGDEVEAAREALADGADINARDWLGRGPLHHATKRGHVAVTAFLLEQGADPNLLSEGRNRAPHFEAEKDKQAGVIGPLAEGGANLNAVDCWGWTALEHAASAGEVRLTVALLAAGADPLDRTPEEWVREAKRVRAALPRGTRIHRPLEFHTKSDRPGTQRQAPLREAAASRTAASREAGNGQSWLRDWESRYQETQRRREMDALVAMRASIFAWLDRLSAQERLPDDIAGVLVGLFESNKGYALYLTGSRTFDEEDRDWSCNWDFEPRDKCLYLTDETLNDMKWDAFLAETICIIQEYLAEKPESLLAQAKHVGVGFDEGDLEILK